MRYPLVDGSLAIGQSVGMSSALIVIDVQQEYFTGAWPIVHPDRDVAAEHIVAAMRAATAAGIPVVVVQHREPAGSNVFADGSAGQELHPAIAAEHHDHQLFKTYPGCFTGTDLDEWLAARSVDELVLCGFMTHMCVDSTARQALHADLAAIVLADATGTLDVEAPDGTTIPARQVHETELAVIGSAFASIVNTADWIAEISAAGS